MIHLSPNDFHILSDSKDVKIALNPVITGGREGGDSGSGTQVVDPTGYATRKVLGPNLPPVNVIPAQEKIVSSRVIVGRQRATNITARIQPTTIACHCRYSV